MGTPASSSDPNTKLELAFDVGHSSIGWAVLQSPLNSQPSSLDLVGCGVVTFGADDCLASERRKYRQQRRHVRATRKRIALLEKLLAHLGILTTEELKSRHDQAKGDSFAWQRAAEILDASRASKPIPETSPSDFWNILRWYAHNRGYFSPPWANRADEEQGDDVPDTEKVQNAHALMKERGTHTMAETIAAYTAHYGRAVKAWDGDRAKAKKANMPFKEPKPIHFKGLKVAFPRELVWQEVSDILSALKGRISKLDDAFIRTLMGNDIDPLKDPEAWRAIVCPAISLPGRYFGGLLFGQIIPRFDNRIIGQCPITFAEEYQRLTSEGLSHEDAKHRADILAKVPGRNCLEFLEFRWAMTLANIRIGHGAETYRDRDGKEVKLRSLNPDERRKVDAAVRKLGFLKLEPDKPAADGHVRAGKNELREIIVAQTLCDRHNLESLLLHPDAKDGLKLLPVEGDVTAFRVGWACFDDPAHDANGFYRDSALRHRFTTQLLRQQKLSLARLVEQLEKIGRAEVASRIQEAARKEASDRRGKVNEAKLANLMADEFFCPKLKGRARFSRVKLRQAFQEVFRKDKPVHPLEAGGCLEQTDAIKQAAVERDLAEQTNNHLVRHRLLILAGDAKARPKPKRGLLQDLIEDFAGGDKRRISRITIELARDLQEMSGMTNKEKAKELSGKLAHHQKVAADLAEKLRDSNGNPLRDATGRPFAASPGLIRKARILADLDQKCPYTGHDIEFVHLAKPHPMFGTADKDHIIPRSKRLSDALEAQIITFSELNRLKGQRTALQFIKDMNLPENKHHKDRFGIRTEAQFRAFVGSLWPAYDPFKRARAGGKKASDDEARCWRRKELLLKATWDEKEFTPADLAKTRHIVKLAAQKLEAGFTDLAKEERPPVIAITGAVTAAFRDKTWKLLGELAAVNPAVKDALAQGAKEWDAGRDFNPKKAVRGITHLHHALDSIALGLVTSLLVPPKHQSLDGDLARFIVKGKLDATERKKFEDRRHELGLGKFFRWAARRCDKPDNAAPDAGGMLCIDDLPPAIKAQIRQRLAEKRVVQHIPADMSGMKVEENTRGVVRVVNGKHELNPPHDKGALPAKKLVGLQPEAGKGKLTPQRGVRVITDNFGVAILDNNPENRFQIIPWFKVHPRIYKGIGAEKSLVEQNGGTPPRILRNGMLIRIGMFRVLKPTRVLENSVWAVDSIGDFDGVIKVDLKPCDAVHTRYEVPDPKDPTGKKMKKATAPGCKLSTDLERVWEGGLEILKPSLCGVAQPAAPCPTTSSA